MRSPTGSRRLYSCAQVTINSSAPSARSLPRNGDASIVLKSCDISDRLSSMTYGVACLIGIAALPEGYQANQQGEPRDAAPHLGSPPVRPSIQRMQRWPKSTPVPYIIGQAPAITLMLCCRQYST